MPEYEKLEACLKQKVVLLKKTMNITKQLEVQSKLPDIELNGLPQQRQIYIDRLKKCDALISNLINQLSAEQQVRMKKILSADFRKIDCESSELTLFEYGVQCRSLLRSITAMDTEILRRVSEERGRLQKLVSVSRGNADRNMFYNQNN